jgi:hypothetical protein
MYAGRTYLSHVAREELDAKKVEKSLYEIMKG